jgi:crotonobetainyl-CoA:carnitine CoA-transferase CaiB-like acyl-CoA transferase
MIGIPVKLKTTPGKVQGPSPLLGEHTEEILSKLGYSAGDIAAMEKDGIIKVERHKGKK